ncbi:Druantia anti-phage system protein DruA [Kiritimatiella glycovorans]|nr:Druantia anti-phage system protein DruA [Kiritimatiella glycovorans]
MAQAMVIQGRRITDGEIALIRDLMAEHRDWGRTRLSEELCRCWNWRNAQGRIKDMAARSLLLKLERRGCIELPARQRPSSNHFRNRCVPAVEPAAEPIRSDLSALRPLSADLVAPRSDNSQLFKGLLGRYHYLGHRNTVGENLRYLIRDRHGRLVACALFGSAAWKCADRDRFLGWDRACRERNLQALTNNTRFLILPWVEVPHLASHVLGLIARRIRDDWQGKYAHPVHALETFVDRSRFKGTCYRAANWMRLGATQGRTRNDRDRRIQAPVKDVYLYPLIPEFRRELCAPACSRTEGRAGR